MCEVHPCAQWAQWRVATAEKDSEGKMIRLNPLGVLCAIHKAEIEASDTARDLDLRFAFTGAIADGIDCSKP
jgi:hypothetical protein